MQEYTHGYTQREAVRLNDQANALDALLHHDSVWERGSMILEAGCGVGAQTKIIAPRNAESHFISIDISQDSITQAEKLISTLRIKNVTFRQADIYELPFENNYFDHVFVCFVLEHLANPPEALTELKRVLKTVTIPGCPGLFVHGAAMNQDLQLLLGDREPYFCLCNLSRKMVAAPF